MSRSATLLAPIVAAFVLSIQDYGRLELALSVGNVLSVVFAAGLPSILPRWIVRRRLIGQQTIFVLHGTVITLVVAGFFALANGLIASIAMIAGVMAMQQMLAAKEKSYGHASTAALFDSLIYLSLLAFCAAIAFEPRLLPESVAPERAWHLVLLLSALLLGVFLMRNIHLTEPRHLRRMLSLYGAILQRSVHFIAAGVAALGFMASSRIAVDWLLGSETVGRYSLMFRITALVVPIYQFYAIIQFRKLFISGPNDFESEIAKIIGLLTPVSLGTLLVVLMARELGVSVLSFSEASTFVLISLVLALQSYVWLMSSALEMRFAKLAIGRPLTIAMCIGIAAFSFYVLGIDKLRAGSLIAVVNSHAACQGLIVLVQIKQLQHLERYRFGRLSLILMLILLAIFAIATLEVFLAMNTR